MNLQKLLCITFKEFILKCHYKLVDKKGNSILCFLLGYVYCHRSWILQQKISDNSKEDEVFSLSSVLTNFTFLIRTLSKSWYVNGYLIHFFMFLFQFRKKIFEGTGGIECQVLNPSTTIIN